VLSEYRPLNLLYFVTNVSRTRVVLIVYGISTGECEVNKKMGLQGLHLSDYTAFTYCSYVRGNPSASKQNLGDHKFYKIGSVRITEH
jgi:hypothetical protein